MSDDTEKAAGEVLESQQDELDEAVADEQDDEPVAVPDRNTELMSILEAAVFASNEVLSAQRLKAILPGQPDGRTIRRLVRSVNEKLQRERHPFEVVEVGGGYQFRTVPYYHPWVQQVFKEKAARRLSIQALECLAITAYRQPLTKAEIEAIRGVTSDGAMKTLLEKRLVTVAGRSDKPGHPLLYGTTPVFLQYFGLNRLGDLPKIEEFEAMAREKMDDLSEEELQQIEELTAEEEEAVEADEAGEEFDSVEEGGEETVAGDTVDQQTSTADGGQEEGAVQMEDDAVEFSSEDMMENAEGLSEDSGGDDEDDITAVLAAEGASTDAPDDDDEENGNGLPIDLGDVVEPNLDDEDEDDELSDDEEDEPA